jgi:type II secretory pathway component PulJ
MQLNRSRHHRRLGCAGFSLVELLVATGLGLVAIATFLSFNRFQLFALQDQSTQIDLQTTARNVLDLFAREVRRAGMDRTCAGTFSGITIAKYHEVRIKADLNGNGAIDGVNEDVTYRYNFEYGAVERVTTTSVERLISGVDLSGSNIRYFDATGVELFGWLGLPLAQRNAVRRVRMELRLTGETADPNKATDLGAFASTDVNLRNRFFVAATACGSS